MVAENLFDLSGKVALVTGGTRGIGRGIALALARAGADVVATSRKEDHVRQATQEIIDLGRRSIAILTDVTKDDDRKRMVQETLKAFGRIDIFVSNAGASPLYKKAIKTTEAEWDQIMDLNLKGSFFSCLEVGKVMIAQKSGRIIIIGSVSSRVALPNLVPYTISKSALLGMTRGLALEWHKYNIRVNSLAPGWVESDLTAEVMTIPTLYQEILKKIPLNRFATPEELGKVAVMLASEAADYLVGETIWVDGGYLVE